MLLFIHLSVFMRKLIISIALACSAHFSHAIESVPCSLGVWSIAESRDSVQAFADHGPYIPVKVTGGLETFNANISGVKGNVSFVFGDENRLTFMQHFAYEGGDMELAKSKFIELAQYWGANLGGYKIDGIRIGDSEILPSSMANFLFKATIENPLTAIQKTAAQKKEMFLPDILFHAAPAKQPAACNLHMLYGYTWKNKTFFVLYFVDRKDYVRNIPPVGITIGGADKAGG